LVAEDNLTNREVIIAQLRKLGYEPAVATNGLEAVEALEHQQFDLILMDCQMPLMDGYEATYRIRRSTHAQIPIIALTASAMSNDRERCLAEGMDDYLAKPVELLDLAKMLHKWIARSSRCNLACEIQSCEESTSQIFNADSLLDRLMEDRDLAGAILKEFLKDAPSQLKQLCALLDDSNVVGLKLQAHTLKGAAGTVGAEVLQTVAQTIETDASEGRLDRCPELLVRAIEEFGNFKKSVEEYEGAPRVIEKAKLEQSSEAN